MRNLVCCLVLSLIGVIAPAVAIAEPVTDEANGLEDRANFGDSPLVAVIEAASAASAGASCAITANQLAALMLAPVWAETVSNSLVSTPSPMVLSRYDHGAATLFPFGDVESPYGAFWHPGIGLWQMDSAGLGADYTADQRIDVSAAGPVVAEQVALLYCLAGFELAFADWFACQLYDCVATYETIYDPVLDQLRDLTTTPISVTGGMQYRLCRFGGVQFTCGYVDPALAQGNASFAVESFGPAPITSPFYVLRSGAVEIRVWLRVDSGDAIDLQAIRLLGTNARAGISWSQPAGFCDLTIGQGACAAAPPVSPTPGPATPGPATPGPSRPTPVPAATPTAIDTAAGRCSGLEATVVIPARVGVTIQGTPGDDVIVGTSGDDIIDGQGGADVICGGGGDDSIVGGPGNDRIFGGDGNDSIWGQGGDDELVGADGADRLRGGDGADRLDGGAGVDDLNGGRGDDRVSGGAGDDAVLRGGTGNDVVDGGPGHDKIVSGNGGADQVFGGEGNDALVSGGPRPDSVHGGAGNDLIRGLGGADFLYGDAGDDDVRGGAQPDTIDGGTGTDSCNGGTENDVATNCEALAAIP